MATTIYKYELKPEQEQTIDMPKYAKILSVQVQHDKVCVWAIVGTTKDHQTMPVTFYIVGTGTDANTVSHKKFLGTVQLNDGNFVFHVFYEVPWYE